MKIRLSLLVLASFLPAAAGLTTSRPTVILNDPAYPKFNATAIDQPVLDVYLTDPLNGNQVFTDYNDWEERDYPVIIKAFVDTGASGFVISHLTATGLYDVPALHLTQNDYIGKYTEIGIGGTEEGKVSRPLGVHVLNGQRYMGHEGNLVDFSSYGDFNLWVRQEEGMGEKFEIMGFVIPNPIHIVGMPVIRQGIMVMDPSGLQGDEPEYLATYIVPHGTPLPEHNITLELYLYDFVGETPPPGEVFPSHASNPMVPHVTVKHTAGSSTGNWLFDTGAGSSFLAFGHAKEVGLIPANYEDLDSFVSDHAAAGGKVAVVGGIGTESITVPILNVSEIRIPAKEGFDIVWQNVDILIKDIPELTELGLDGIFGMNLIMPSVTIDSNDPENWDQLMDMSPGMFRTIIFDPSDEQNVELRLHTFNPLLLGGYASWRTSRFPGEMSEQELVSGPSADPDGDGVPNLLEYAFAGDPLASDRSVLPAGEVLTVNGQKYLALTYRQSLSAPDVTYHVESSSDLVSWAPAATETVTSIENDDHELITVRKTETLGSSPRKFLRIRVEMAD